MTLKQVLNEVRQLPEFYGRNIRSVKDTGISGDTPLHAVVFWNNVEALEALLAAGADANAIGEMGKTPMHYAVASENLEIARILL